MELPKRAGFMRQKALQQTRPAESAGSTNILMVHKYFYGGNAHRMRAGAVHVRAFWVHEPGAGRDLGS